MNPFELTPSRTIIPGERLNEAGDPAGVVHIVPAPGLPAGAILANHPGVDMAAFTGSTALCRGIAAAAFIPQKKVAFERGGKNGPVIFPDADLAAAAFASCRRTFQTSGLGHPLYPAAQVGAFASREGGARIDPCLICCVPR